MPSLRCIIKKYQYQGKLTKEEADELFKKLDNHDKVLIDNFVKQTRETEIEQLQKVIWRLGFATAPIITNTSEIRGCKDCDTYRHIINGETVIGDMCTFCSRNPNKITCNSASAGEIK